MAYPPEDRQASLSGAEPPMPKAPTFGEPPISGTAEPHAAEPPMSVTPVTTELSTPELTSGVGGEPAEKQTSPVREPVKLAPTRTSGMWLGVWAGVIMVIFVIIFVAQNTASVEINFLWMSGEISLALALLIAAVAGAVIAMAVAAARILQLRRMVRRAR
jgi:uncharacterized integral membrane protein